MIVTCPRCFQADDVSYQRLPDHVIMYHCTNRHQDGEPHDWLVTREESAPMTLAAVDGVVGDLLEPLLACLEPGEPFVEFGVVEYRLRQRDLDLFRRHVAERGHVLLGTRRVTASAVRFGVALGMLARAGEIVGRLGRATGAWSYNARVNYWARLAGADWCVDQLGVVLCRPWALAWVGGRGLCSRGRTG